MNNAMKTASNSCLHLSSISFRASLFHSTPVSERRRKTHWDSRCNNYGKRFRKAEARRTLLRNVSAYADNLFQSWKSDNSEYDQPSSKGTSWFKTQWANGTKSSHESRWESYRSRLKGRRGFEFCCSDDDDVETIFRSSFGGERFFYWSFSSSENFQRNSSGYSNYKCSWRSRMEDEYDSTDYNSCGSDLASDRLALGLSASGPLKLEEVKSAYRACALRWHPDRHQGSSKVSAEEKFKHCSAAYKSLCDKLAMD
ncbi:uncharacterized protein LOC131243118 isoform X2 [Magnolia sinica]|uniref:uncharacterized protein LOC131243118 isoform X2 n=1 Tax=Magnolia sinica TaxID=86752 RepID=UPI002657FB16|nr:uncharacterized protein LOC131243118 isoform X2 [Magnolia sinica]